MVTVMSLNSTSEDPLSVELCSIEDFKSLAAIVLLLMLCDKAQSTPIVSSTSAGAHHEPEQQRAEDYNATLLVITNKGNIEPAINKPAKMKVMKGSPLDQLQEATMVSASLSSSSSVAQFNERRRDMFLEDYSNSIKQIEVVDTSLNSSTPSLTPSTQSSSPTIIVIQQQPQSQPQPPTATAAAVASLSTLKPKLKAVNSSSSSLMPVSVTPSTSGGTPSITYTINETRVTTYHQKEKEQNFQDQQQQEQHSVEMLQPQRPNVLMPKIEPNLGRPACVKSPDDTFCEMVDTYPKNAIKEEITISRSQFTEIFGHKEMDGRTSPIDDNINEEPVCRKLQRMIYPQMAKNQANQWIYVVNEVEYAQAVVAEVCEKPGKACAYLDQNLPPGMYSRCKQKYSYKRLLALHPTEKRTYSDSFKFPSCCSCYIKFDDLLARSSFRKIDSSARPDILDNGKLVPNADTNYNTGGFDNREREGQTRDTRSSATPIRTRSRVGESNTTTTTSKIRSLGRTILEVTNQTPIYYLNQTWPTNNMKYNSSSSSSISSSITNNNSSRNLSRVGTIA